MVMPYNVFKVGGDVIWVGAPFPGYDDYYYEDAPIGWYEGELPPEGVDQDFWNMYYIQGVPDWPKPLPWHNIVPWEYWASLNHESRYHKPRSNNSGADYDQVNQILSFYQLYLESGANPGADYEDYRVQIANIDGRLEGDWEILNHSAYYLGDPNGDLMFYDPWQGYWRVLLPCWYGCGFRYVYPRAGGNSVLAFTDDYGFLGISLDNGASFDIIIVNAFLESVVQYEPACYPQSYYCIASGPPGSDTIVWGGYNELFVTQDLATASITLQIDGSPEYFDPPTNEEPNPYYINNCAIDLIFCVECNRKPYPGTIWLAASRQPQSSYGPGDGAGLIVRNTTAKCNINGWEQFSRVVVSSAYQNDIFEGTCFYPDDYPTTYLQGQPYARKCWPTLMKYLPGTDTFWIFGYEYGIDYLLFSNDGGITWRKDLCDHSNPANWPNMHPFLSPRIWPWSESYSLYTTLGASGHGFISDIVEHPDDPNIIVTVGQFWLKTPYDYSVEDPAGRTHIWPGGIVTPMSDLTPLTTDIMNSLYPHYLDGQLYEHYAYNAISISLDGGATWGRPTSTFPRWTTPPAQTTGYGRDIDMTQYRIWACQ